ncbi:trichohyalin-like [Cimex lectularius]|uniref:Uncharacterized protein n=1 Tax=Cimex lectularius TaxID=79782 RepID=A0A8I6S7E8_CIMLE|nr:trichohyalin-like [Cimex lectularius]
MDDNQVEFVLKTDRKCLQTAVNQMVNKRIDKCGRNLEQRRLKLHNSLYEETQQLNKELEIYNAKMKEMEEINKRTKAMQIQASIEAKEREMVAQKEALRHKLYSDDKKFQEFVNQRHDVAIMQKQQMLEKRKIESNEKTLDKIWEEISREWIAITDTEEARKKTHDIIKKKIYHENLSEQIREKMEFAKEELYQKIMQKVELEELAKLHEINMKKENEEKQRERMRMAKAKYENYKQSLMVKKFKRNEEALLNKYYQEMNAYDPFEEKYRIQKEKEQMRLELDLYKEHVLTLRQKQKEEDLFEDELRKKEAAEKEEKQNQIIEREKLERIKQEQDVMRMRMEQILMKREDQPYYYY